MAAMWTQTYTFRERGSAPERLVITAWGRRFTVVPSEKLRAAASGRSAVVVIDVVGPAAPPHDLADGVTEVVGAPDDVIELVYESGDDITAVNSDIARSAAKLAMGTRHGA